MDFSGKVARTGQQVAGVLAWPALHEQPGDEMGCRIVENPAIAPWPPDVRPYELKRVVPQQSLFGTPPY